MIDYKANPFFLDDEKIDWVEKTFESMTLDEKIGQLFCPIVFTKDKKELKEFVESKHPGGVLYREGPGEELYEAHKALQEYSRIPLLTTANLETVSNKTTARLNWHTMFGLGNNMPWMANEMPCGFISLGNPYHLFDAPMIHTYINGYCNSDYVIDAILDKMLGRGTFKGVSPIDPFCGRKELAY